MTDTLTLNILVVDHDVYFRTLCTRRLRRSRSATFQVSIAESASSALHLIEQNEFDCALIDVRLPDMTGTELMEVIHQQCEMPFPMILLCPTSGRTDDSGLATSVLPKREVANYGMISSILSAISNRNCSPDSADAPGVSSE